MYIGTYLYIFDFHTTIVFIDMSDLTQIGGDFDSEIQTQKNFK